VGPGARSVISAGDLQDVVAVNAYEVVRLLRPEWLTVRPADILGDSPSQTLPVYLDDFLLGGIASLRNLPIQDIELIRFVSTAVATARWGIGHNNGAIQVITTG